MAPQAISQTRQQPPCILNKEPTNSKTAKSSTNHYGPQNPRNPRNIFHYFMFLPTELRLMIWNLATPRIMNIMRDKKDEFHLWTGNRIPPLLYTCHESRNLLLSKYNYEIFPANNAGNRKGMVMVDFNIETFHIYGPIRRFEFSSAGSLPTSVFSRIERDDVKKITSLIVDITGLSEMNSPYNIAGEDLVSCFPVLKEILFIPEKLEHLEYPNPIVDIGYPIAIDFFRHGDGYDISAVDHERCIRYLEALEAELSSAEQAGMRKPEIRVANAALR
ncbi:hypothetical protein HYFRA_00003478 [Hymenoscyphus fraxineus]|uniref:2EXR domain-containing protein n=1 Tax=Hymenoscyphus fraxineus TaxID=746836 RepID=A0A9N9PSD2_9HELO|nr:hypothetical protein HYFRA_00003478 [Hymenoscyphus fraxineus]